MHEYSLVTRLLETINQISEHEGLPPIKVVIALGEFDIVTQEQICELVKLQIANFPSLPKLTLEFLKIPGKYLCSECHNESNYPRDFIRTGSHEVPIIISCRLCGGTNVDLIEGDETYIENIVF
jgi:Zn finger protein HypA/HybF involved in hydrogenase expression